MSYEKDMDFLRSESYDRWKCDPPEDDDYEEYNDDDRPEEI